MFSFSPRRTHTQEPERFYHHDSNVTGLSVEQTNIKVVNRIKELLPGVRNVLTTSHIPLQYGGRR